MTRQAHMKCLSPVLKQMNALCIVFWLQQTRIMPHFTIPLLPQQLNLGSKAGEIHFH